MKAGIVLVVVICVAAYLIGRDRGRAKGRKEAMRKLTAQYEDGVIRSHVVRQGDRRRGEGEKNRAPRCEGGDEGAGRVTKS